MSKAAIPTLPAPTEATAMPTICFFVKFVAGAPAAAAVSEVVTNAVLEARPLLDGDPVALLRGDELELVVRVMLKLFETRPDVVVAAGAIKTILGIDVSTTSVAVIVLWVFGNALAWPTHMLKAEIATSSIELSQILQPVQ